ATLQLALTAALRVSHEILEGLSANDLKGAVSNALVAHPAGILHGVDYQHSGRVERVDTGLLHALLDRDVVPIVPPVGCDGEGHSYRLNSDAVAVEVARSLHAVKLIYLTTYFGIPEAVVSGQWPVAGEEQTVADIVKQLSVEEAEAIVKRQKEASA